MSPKKPLLFILEKDLDPDYDEKARILDCQTDPSFWENIQPYQEEFDLFTKSYLGLISPHLKLNDDQTLVTVPIINDFGIRDCLRYPKEKCVYFKPAFCEDMYSIPPKKNETKSLEDSFVGVLNHRFNETRRRNNRFARRSVTPNKNRMVRKNELPSSNYVRELVLGVPTMNTNAVYLPLEPSRKQNENKLNTLVRDIKKLHLSNSDKNISNTTTTRSSRSRVRDNTLSSQLRSTSRTRSRVRDNTPSSRLRSTFRAKI